MPLLSDNDAMYFVMGGPQIDPRIYRNKLGITSLQEDDTWYRCNVCGREGRVGRCCSDEDRTPLNALAKAEQAPLEN